MAKVCHGCGTEWRGESPGRGDLCPSCGRPLRCCLNCAFYDPVRAHQCRIPDIEPVAEKAAANFCGEFVFADRPAGFRGDDAAGRAAKAAWENLFKR